MVTWAYQRDYTLGSLAGGQTFARAAGANTYVAADGDLDVAATNTARFSYDAVTLDAIGLLIERSRENVHVYSEDINQWTLDTGSGTALVGSPGSTSNTVVAPDGATTADEVNEHTNNGIHYAYKYLASDAADKTYSVFLKAGERSRMAMQLGAGARSSGVSADVNLATPAIGLATLVSGSYTRKGSGLDSYSARGFYRAWLSATVPASTHVNYFALQDSGGNNSYQGVANEGMAFWGQQIEVGLYPSSYIPTGAAAVTRPAETLIESDISAYWNDAEGTILIRGRIDHHGISRNVIKQFDDNTANNRHVIYATDGDQLRYEIIVGGASQGDVLAGQYYPGQEFVLVCSYATGSMKASVDGGTPASAAPASLPTCTRARTGHDSTGNQMDGFVQYDWYADTQASDAEMKAAGLPEGWHVFMDTRAGDSFEDWLIDPADATVTIAAGAVDYTSATSDPQTCYMANGDGATQFDHAFDTWRLEVDVSSIDFVGADQTSIEIGEIDETPVFFGADLRSGPGGATGMFDRIQANGSPLGNGNILTFTDPGVSRVIVERAANILTTTQFKKGASEFPTTSRIVLPMTMTDDSYKVPAGLRTPMVRFTQGTHEINRMRFMAGNKNADVGFCGDSLTQGIKLPDPADAWPQIIRADNPALTVLLWAGPGNTTADFLAVIDTYLVMAPAHTYLLLGANDIVIDARSPAAIEADMTSIASAFTTAGLGLTWLTISPVGAAYTNVPVVNAWMLANLADVIDIHPLLEGSTDQLHADYNSGDGIHFNVAGHAVVHAQVEAHMAEATAAPADASHGHSVDNVTMAAHAACQPADATHGHAADGVAQIAHAANATADATHSHSADNAALAAKVAVTPADATHNHSADGAVVAAKAICEPADATHGHSVDSPSQTAFAPVAPAAAGHGHTADNVIIPPAAPVTPVDATHGHSADIVTLIAKVGCAPADATHGHSADNVIIPPSAPATIAGATHGHTADNVVSAFTPGYTTRRRVASYASRRVAGVGGARLVSSL